MKKFLLTLFILLLLGGLVAGGTILTKEVVLPALQKKPASQQTPQEDVSSQDASDTQAGQQPNLGIYKRVQSGAEMLEALDYEYRQNPDTVGWLRVPGTEINNSVLQSFDNNYYLRLTERKQPDIYGCYFADYASWIGKREEMGPNTVIYGHSDLQDNPDGPRFSQLFRFTDPAFARSTPYIEFSTMEDFMDWQVFAVFYPSVEMDYINTNLTGAQLVALAEDAKAQSIYDYGVTVGPEDKILTLSTCTIKFGREDTSHRFVIMAKLVAEDAVLEETAEITVK